MVFMHTELIIQKQEELRKRSETARKEDSNEEEIDDIDEYWIQMIDTLGGFLSFTGVKF